MICALYLAWLLCIQCHEVDEDTRESLVPSGLNRLSEALEYLVEFLRIDTDLLAVAAEQSAEQVALPTDIEEWIRDLPEAEKNALLLSLIKGQDPQLGARLLQRYRAAAGAATVTTPTERRTVGVLLEAAARRRRDRYAPKQVPPV